MPLHPVLLGGLVALAILAPLPFGCVERGWSALLTSACLLLGALWVIARARRGAGALPWRDPVLHAGALLALVGALQLVPLPRAVLGTVSPTALELRDRYEPAAPEGAGSWRPISLDPWSTRQATLRVIAFTLVALLALDLIARPGGRGVMVGGLVASGAFQAIYGLWEYFSGRQQIFGYSKKYYTDVLTGTFINRNHLAGFIEMTLPLAIALAAVAVMRLRAGRRASPAERLRRASGRDLFVAVALLLLALVMTTALLASRSRMGIASCLLALLVVGALLLWRGHARGFAAATLLVAGAAGLMFSQADATSPIVGRFQAVFREFSGELGRGEIWSQAATVAGAFPITGVGWGAFPEVFPAFRTRGPGIALAHAHNDYLELAAETGLIGVVAALAGLVLILRGTLRNRARRPDYGQVGYAAAVSLLALAMHSLTDFNLAIPANALTATLLLALLLGWRRIPPPIVVHGTQPERDGAPAAGSSPAWIAPAGALACLALIALLPTLPLPGPSLYAASVSTDAPSLREDEDFRPPALIADDADGWFAAAAAVSASPITDLQSLAQAEAIGTDTSADAAAYVAARLESAMRLVENGLRHLPTSARGYLLRGRLRLAGCAARSLAGDDQPDCLGTVLGDLQAALALGPMSATHHAQAAALIVGALGALDEGDRQVASRIVERAVALNPRDARLAAAWQEWNMEIR